MLELVSFLFELDKRRLRTVNGWSRYYKHIEIKIDIEGEIHSVVLHGSGSSYQALSEKDINDTLKPYIQKAERYIHLLMGKERDELIYE